MLNIHEIAQRVNKVDQAEAIYDLARQYGTPSNAKFSPLKLNQGVYVGDATVWFNATDEQAKDLEYALLQHFRGLGVECSTVAFGSSETPMRSVLCYLQVWKGVNDEGE